MRAEMPATQRADLEIALRWAAAIKHQIVAEA
jgi:hypothetical protein